MTIKYLPHGLNEENVILVEDTVAGPIADAAPFTITVADQKGAGRKVLSVAVATEVGGPALPGARVWLNYPALVAAAAAGIEFVSYNEATGVLTLNNQTGGALSNIHVTALLVPAGAI